MLHSGRHRLIYGIAPPTGKRRVGPRPRPWRPLVLGWRARDPERVAWEALRRSLRMRYARIGALAGAVVLVAAACSSGSSAAPSAGCRGSQGHPQDRRHAAALGRRRGRRAADAQGRPARGRPGQRGRRHRRLQARDPSPRPRGQREVQRAAGRPGHADVRRRRGRHRRGGPLQLGRRQGRRSRSATTPACSSAARPTRTRR